MAITYVIEFTVVVERRQQFLTLINGVLDAMRHEPMFHEAVLHQDPDSENRFMLYETWEDHEDVVEVQLKRPYRKAWHDALPEILVGERGIAIWRPLRADPPSLKLRRAPSCEAPHGAKQDHSAAS